MKPLQLPVVAINFHLEAGREGVPGNLVLARRVPHVSPECSGSLLISREHVGNRAGGSQQSCTPSTPLSEKAKTPKAGIEQTKGLLLPMIGRFNNDVQNRSC